jgi:hypothetical protein
MRRAGRTFVVSSEELQVDVPVETIHGNGPHLFNIGIVIPDVVTVSSLSIIDQARHSGLRRIVVRVCEYIPKSKHSPYG